MRATIILWLSECGVLTHLWLVSDRIRVAFEEGIYDNSVLLAGPAFKRIREFRNSCLQLRIIFMSQWLILDSSNRSAPFGAFLITEWGDWNHRCRRMDKWPGILGEIAGADFGWELFKRSQEPLVRLVRKPLKTTGSYQKSPEALTG